MVTPGRRPALWGMIRSPPLDLTVTVSVTLLTAATVLFPAFQETPVRRILGMGFLLLFPGYALVSLLFPKAGEGLGSGTWHNQQSRPDENPGTEESLGVWVDVVLGGDHGIDWIERLTLSFGLSIVVVPLVGFVIAVMPVDLGPVPVVLAVGGFTTVCAFWAAVRRWSIPPEERFQVRWRQRATAALFEPEDRVVTSLNALLILSACLSVLFLAGTVLFPPAGEQYTEFSLLTDTPDGPMAEGYPEELTVNESADLIIQVTNKERATTEYTVVVQLQRVDTAGKVTEIRSRERLDRFEATLGHNETWQHEHTVSPSMSGDGLRLKYLLYRGQLPSEVTAETAYSDLHIWLNISRSADEMGV